VTRTPQQSRSSAGVVTWEDGEVATVAGCENGRARISSTGLATGTLTNRLLLQKRARYDANNEARRRHGEARLRHELEQRAPRGGAGGAEAQAVGGGEAPEGARGAEEAERDGGFVIWGSDGSSRRIWASVRGEVAFCFRECLGGT